jgi:acyl CoA:acetate/3-ketoacid CoA transferase
LGIGVFNAGAQVRDLDVLPSMIDDAVRWMMVTEIAPGMRLQEEVLDQLDFELRVSPDLQSMDPRTFRVGPMGIRQVVLGR